METKTFYLTKAKLKELKKEYEELLVSEKHRAGQDEAPKLFESEDLNPDFVNFKENVDFLRNRIDELKNIFENCVIIKNPSKDKKDVIDLGAKVKIDIDGQKDEFVLVGTLEANPFLGKISNESPVGAALIGHKVGDEVVIPSPVKTVYKIKSIKYEIS
jgi:transcription elongation factor GreA